MFYSKKLKKLKKIKHCFFSRKNGFSKGIYKSLNCGKGSKDNKNNINKNLNFVAKKMDVEKTKLILMNQTHSNKVVEIKKYNCLNKINADAIITKMNGYAIGVLTADCVPIIIYDARNKIIGCIHAGWKGAFSGIIGNTIKKIKKLNSNNKIYAGVGPCIGEKNYEVDTSFEKKFIKKNKNYSKFFTKKNINKSFFNLRGLINYQLKELGIKKIHNINLDTYTHERLFFSHRRSKHQNEKTTGRLINLISLT